MRCRGVYTLLCGLILVATVAAAANKEPVVQLLSRAEQGDIKAQAELCGKYTLTGDADPPDAATVVTWCRNAADQGYAEGQFGLGVMIFLGQGVAQDNAEAVKWYRKAAEQGHARAQATLGAMYVAATHVAGYAGLPQDYAEALKWARRAAEQNDRMGQFILGLMYANGWSVTQNDAEAEKWFLKGLEDHDPEELVLAQFNMGNMYTLGSSKDLPLPHNTIEAVKWYRRAADLGLAAAQFRLGDIYASGDGVPQDSAEAEKWYRKAAEHRDVEEQGSALMQLGNMYTAGYQAPQNDTEAARWYRRAAELGLAEAQFKLGGVYAEGIGVPQDDAEAVKWYRMAADQGDDGAQEVLRVLALKAVLAEKGLELSPSDRRLIQVGLAAEGFDPGPADGLFGPRTRDAIRRWQTSQQEASTGYLDAESAKVLLASGRKREVRENAQRWAATAEHRGREKQAAKEMWRCFAFSGDHNKTTVLFTLTHVRRSSEDFGEVSVAGTTHLASFEIAGLNRRWDFGYDEMRNEFLYAFIIKPNGTGLYYDFSSSSDGTAKPSGIFECLMSH